MLWWVCSALANECTHLHCYTQSIILHHLQASHSRAEEKAHSMCATNQINLCDQRFNTSLKVQLEEDRKQQVHWPHTCYKDTTSLDSQHHWSQELDRLVIIRVEADEQICVQVTPNRRSFNTRVCFPKEDGSFGAQNLNAIERQSKLWQDAGAAFVYNSVLCSSDEIEQLSTFLQDANELKREAEAVNEV